VHAARHFAAGQIAEHQRASADFDEIVVCAVGTHHSLRCCPCHQQSRINIRGEGDAQGASVTQCIHVPARPLRRGSAHSSDRSGKWLLDSLNGKLVGFAAPRQPSAVSEAESFSRFRLIELTRSS
jgi:hypothetical protein